MREVLQFLKDEYGGIISYLTQLGFGPGWQERIRKNIATNMG